MFDFVISVRLKIEPLRRHKFLIELSYISLVLCCYVYAFCLRTNKDSSVGEFDASVISVFNIIFESILFLFEFVLFNSISFLELFYFNCKLFNFRDKYSTDWVLEQKKGVWSWFGLKIRRLKTKIWRPPS